MSIANVLIVGSCVSRDPFGHRVSHGGDFAIIDYYARTSFASLACAPVMSGFDLSANASPFQRKMIEHDFAKDIFQALETMDYDIILLDFIDDRFNLLVLPDGSGMTDSNEFRAAKLNLSEYKPRTVKAFTEEYSALWGHGWACFLDRMKALGRSDRILINKVFWSTRDDQGQPLPNPVYIANANHYLTDVYDRIASDLSAVQFVSYGGLDFVASTSHKWGISPFHYIKIIEDTCLREVKRMYLANTR